MKKVLFVTLFFVIVLAFTGCSEKAYSFRNSVDEIERIEIVSAENSLSFTVIKTLSETEKDDFLERFQAIRFHSYYMGDPMSVHGDAIKITYRGGDYEMVCYYWAEYVKNGQIYSVRKSCDEGAFYELLNRFLEDEAR